MSERLAVQQPMIKYADEIDWRYIKPEVALQLRVGERKGCILPKFWKQAHPTQPRYC